MTSFVVKNNAESTVADNPLAQAATTLNVAAGGGGEFPSTFPFLITLWDESTYPDPTDDSGMEIVKCTGRTTDALTIVRAQEGTADVAHSLNERVAMLITAGILNDATYGLATKLDGIEASADVTDATNVNAAGAEMTTSVQSMAIASDGSITPNGSRLIKLDTFENAATDDLIHIYTTNYEEGSLITIYPNEATHDISVIDKDNSGSNLYLEGDVAFTMAGLHHNITFICLNIVSTLKWFEYRRFNG